MRAIPSSTFPLKPAFYVLAIRFNGLAGESDLVSNRVGVVVRITSLRAFWGLPVGEMVYGQAFFIFPLLTKGSYSQAQPKIEPENARHCAFVA